MFPFFKRMRLPALAAFIGLQGALAQEESATLSPRIPLFTSVETVKEFLNTKARLDYSRRVLVSVSLHHSTGQPRKGEAWVYSFVDDPPKLGGGVSIYHFTDGEIIEFQHGP